MVIKQWPVVTGHLTAFIKLFMNFVNITKTEQEKMHIKQANYK